MTTVTPIIDSEKIVEILFENSEIIPNNVYVDVMNLMKRYHECGDNEEEIRKYLKGIDQIILNKFDQYIVKQPFCVIKIKMNCVNCDNCVNCVNCNNYWSIIKKNWYMFAIPLVFIAATAGLCYGLYINYNRPIVRSPPPRV